MDNSKIQVTDIVFKKTYQYLNNQNASEHTYLLKVGEVHPCTGTEALYRSYGP